MTGTALKKTSIFLALAGLLVVSRWRMERLYELPFPHFDALLTKTSGIQDPVIITMGFRSLAADVAWVQLLQTMGKHGDIDKTGKNFPYLKQDTLRVTRIDPYFKSAYLFGAATLAWLRNINRPDEAMEILAEGARYNPTYWPLRTYAAGIGYMKTNQMDDMIRMLEDAGREPDCPTMVKVVLANSYKTKKRYADALLIWEGILASEKGRDYHGRAREEIPKIYRLIFPANSKTRSGPPPNPPALR